MSDPLLAAMRSGRPLDGVDVIDAHAHLGPYSLFFIPDADARTMVDVMDRTGVRMTVLSSHRAIQYDAHSGNSETLRAVDRFPDRIAGYAVVNPWQQPDRELRRLAAEPRFVGVKLHPDLHEYPLTGALYQPVWEYAAQSGRPVLTHTWHTSAYDDPEAIDAVLARHPGVRLILGHSGVSPAGMAASLAVVRRHPSTYLEICGSSMTGTLVRWLVEQAGADRVLFGSDFPFIDLRFSLGRVIGAGLPAAEAAAVLGGNAAALFGRPPRRAQTLVGTGECRD
ncbi:amidohydrolase family protein [Fodinicola acaciae]|uniref:amidohydrolase family protein n=1 Tax=Fodinicola acaciae TaxID=2681555 RepID=UPI0013D54EB5|nr:amidohydrolase family protein [Fodinicola acaciae]